MLLIAIGAVLILLGLVAASAARGSGRVGNTGSPGTDHLTQVANRRRLDDDLRSHARAEGPIAVARIDVDPTGTVAERFGIEARDILLRQVAAIISRNIRTSDVVYRYRDTEFCVLLNDADQGEAAAIVDRVRTVIGSARVGPGGNPVDLSTGVAVWKPEMLSALSPAIQAA